MKIDSKGNILVGSVAILIISLLIIAIFIITSINYLENENIELKSNNNFKYIIDDYSRNLEVLGRDAIADATQKVYNGLPVFNSENQIKKNLNKKLEEKNKEFENKYGVRISSEVLSVENSGSPWKILFKVKLKVKKDNINYSNIIEKNASIEGLRDPLPLAKLTIASGILTYDNKIHYKNAIAGYMVIHHFKSPESYIEATAPLYITKCPYDPYKHHGDDNGKVMKNCRDNGYYHESRDGACYLCRLEGKGGCEHYGFETFINPQRTNETGRVSACGSDHVIFSDDIYPGVEVIYNNESDDDSNGGMPYEILYLDPHGHKVKYGMGAF